MTSRQISREQMKTEEFITERETLFEPIARRYTEFVCSILEYRESHASVSATDLMQVLESQSCDVQFVKMSPERYQEVLDWLRVLTAHLLLLTKNYKIYLRAS